MTQVLDQALSAFRADGDLKSLSRALNEAAFQTIVTTSADDGNWEAPPVKILGRHRGREVSFLAAFGGQEAAAAFLAEARGRIPEAGELLVASVSGGRLLAEAEVRGLGVWIEPQATSGEGSLFLAAPEIGKLLEPAAADEKPTLVAMADLDLSRSRTLDEICRIFHDESPAELGVRLGRLVEGGVVEAHASPFDPDERLFEPLAVFYLGFLGQGGRCQEFRGWFKNLMAAAYFERGNLAQELMALEKERRELKKSLDFSESFKQKVKREYQKLKARLEDALGAAAAELDEVKLELEKERELRRKEGSAIARLYQEIVELENDLLAVEEWPYPLSLSEVMTAAERLYSSKLIILPGPDRVEVSEPSLERDPRLLYEAVRTLRHLAVDLHPMRFKYGNLDPAAFDKRTGLRLVIPVGRAAASGTACARKVHWRGQDIVCDSYLQNTRDDFRLLVHFKTLADERKFLVSHLTAFAMAGFLKLVPGRD